MTQESWVNSQKGKQLLMAEGENEEDPWDEIPIQRERLDINSFLLGALCLAKHPEKWDKGDLVPFFSDASTGGPMENGIIVERASSWLTFPIYKFILWSCVSSDVAKESKLFDGGW